MYYSWVCLRKDLPKAGGVNMTTNEACENSDWKRKRLYKRIKAGMIPGVVKKGRMFVIPNETPFIPSEQEIRTFLLQILKFKNNPSYVFFRVGSAKQTKTLRTCCIICIAAGLWARTFLLQTPLMPLTKSN